MLLFDLAMQAEPVDLSLNLDHLLRLASGTLPFLAGVFIGFAAGNFRLLCKHNSVLRYGALNNSNHQRMRQYFIGIVNERESFLDQHGQETSGLGVTVKFWVTVGIFMALLYAGSHGFALVAGGLGGVEGANVEPENFPKLVQLIVAVVIWIACRREVRDDEALCYMGYPKGTTKPVERGKVGEVTEWDYYAISATRAEDGTPTKGFKCEKTEDLPNPLRRLFVMA